jgi:hypothetical protein
MIEKILEFEESTKKKGFTPGTTNVDDMSKARGSRRRIP